VLLAPNIKAPLDPPPTTWSQTYGGNGNDSANSVVQTSDGGYAVIGYSNSYGAGSSDFWLVKTDSIGNVQWNRTYGGPASDYGQAIVQTSDGGYAMVGYTSSFGVGGNDFWLIKTDSAGNVQWNKTYGGVDADQAYSLKATADGGYALAGLTYSYGAGFTDFYLVKTDASGNMQWNRTYGGASLDEAYSLVQTSDGGYALAGFTWSFGDGVFWLVKTNSSGHMQWNRDYGGNFTKGRSLVQTRDGGYALTGYTNSSVTGDYDFGLIKTDSSGQHQWNKTYGGPGSDYSETIVQTFDGGYAMAGSTDSFGAGSDDFWIVKTDSTGNIQWNKTSGGTSWDLSYSLIQTKEGGYAVTGSTYSYGAGGYDFWLLKFAPTRVEDSTPPVTVHDYDNLTHYQEFTITLTATDDLSGVAETSYKINDGATRNISFDGQPRVTTEGYNNTLEYWSVDSVGNEESHHYLTQIKLDKSDVQKPTAEAGANQTVMQGTNVTFNGTGSTDNIGIASYTWTLTDVSLQTLLGSNPNYTFNNPGNFEITLNVTDYAGNWNTDTTWVKVLLDSIPPTANAGLDQTVNEDTLAYFDGSASSDNLGIVSYEWDFGDQTTGTGMTTTHIYADPGDYDVTLTVKDAAGNTATDTIYVTVLAINTPLFTDETLILLIAGGIIAVIGVAAVIIMLLRKRK